MRTGLRRGASGERVSSPGGAASPGGEQVAGVVDSGFRELMRVAALIHEFGGTPAGKWPVYPGIKPVVVALDPLRENGGLPQSTLRDDRA